MAEWAHRLIAGGCSSPAAATARSSPTTHAAELLEPPPGTAKKVLEAHRILVTARSLRSVDSSATRTTDAGEAAGCSASARAAVQVEQIKCLLLQALVAALPLLEPAGAWVQGPPGFVRRLLQSNPQQVDAMPC